MEPHLAQLHDDTAPVAPSSTAAPGALPSADLLLDFFRRMLTIRRFEESVYEVYSRGIMPGLAHLYTGMEAVAVGICAVLASSDNITSTHRGHGHLLAKGGDARRMYAELLGRATGYNKGKGGSMHIADVSLGMLGANGIVAGGLGIATGAALSAKIRKDGRISVAFFGDGALNEGLFYEVANMAGLWSLPVVYVLENNGYGEYTPASKSTSGSALARAQALGIYAERVDGNDVLAVYRAAGAAAARTRAGQGPALIECLTYRWRGHHMGDQGDTYRYRTQAEIEEWARLCPIERLRATLLAEKAATVDALRAIEEEVAAQIADAEAFARSSPFPDPAEVYTDVY